MEETIEVDIVGFLMEEGGEEEVVSLEDVYIPFSFLEELLEEVEREDEEEGCKEKGDCGEGGAIVIVNSGQLQTEEKEREEASVVREEVVAPTRKRVITAYGDPSIPLPYVDWSMVPKQERRRDMRCPYSAINIPESPHMIRRYEEPPTYGKQRFSNVKRYCPSK